MLRWSAEGLQVGSIASETTHTERLVAAHGVCEDDEPPPWWQGVGDAALQIGLRPSIVDGSIPQVMAMVSDGATVLTQCPEMGWIGLRRHGRKYQAHSVRNGQTAEETMRRPDRLYALLEAFADDGRVRVVAFDDHNIDLETDVAHRKPFDRLRWLLRAERSDIGLVAVFAFTVGLLTLATPIAVEALVNTVAFGRYLQPIIVLALILFTFLGFSSLTLLLQTTLVEVIQQRLFARVATDLAFRLPRVSTERTDDIDLRELANRFFDVVTVQKAAAKLLLDGIGLVLSVAIGMAVLAFYHPFLLGFDIVLLLAITGIVFGLGRGAVRTAIKESKAKYYMAAWFEDVAGCATTFRSPAGKRMAAGRANRLIHNYLADRQAHFRVLFRQIAFALLLQAIASTVLLGLGGWLVVFGELTLGQLVAAELIVAIIVGGFAKLGKQLESLYDILASVDKLGALFDLPPGRTGGMPLSDSLEPAGVSVSSVSYRGPNGRKLAAPATMDFAPATVTAVTGPAGCGKSTLLELIYGFRVATGGRVLIDGRNPIELAPDDVRRRVELANQGEIFAGTIADNLHVNRSDITGDDVRQALHDVDLHDVVEGLGENLETRLLPGGRPLSMTESLRLLVARSLAARPRLLMIDGLLDPLDEKTVERIMAALDRRRDETTAVIVTHRSDIARRADRSVRMAGGHEAVRS